MPDKMVVNFKDIKTPKLVWKPEEARNLLIKMGAGIQKAIQEELKEINKRNPELTIGGVKCTEVSPGRIQIEWTGTITKNMMPDMLRNAGVT